MLRRTPDQFEILDTLGEGGMGVVYKAHDKKLDRPVALKFLHEREGRTKEDKKRFVNEARSISSLDHPNICTIYDVGETEDGQMFIVMAYYDGEPLSQRLTRGPLPLDTAANIIAQVARGLGKAHSKGIVHRDIKPANIILTNEGEAKIVDFGLARMAGRSTLTRKGTTVGTAGYMAPEQAQGNEVGHRADVWALGVLFYELLTGRRPFDADSEQAVMYRVVNEDPEPVSALCTDTPLALEVLIESMLAKDPEARPGSMGDFLESLDAVLPHAMPPEPPPPVKEKVMRKARFYIPAIAVAVVVLLAGAWGVQRYMRIQQARTVTLLEVRHLMSQNQSVEAFLLLEEAKRVIPNDPAVDELEHWCSQRVTLYTEPQGATVSYKPYATAEKEWIRLGVTPIDSALVPNGYLRWRIEKDGYDTRHIAFLSHTHSITIPLFETAEVPQGMVHAFLPGHVQAGVSEPVEVPPFWIDRYEVTNRQFKEFVDDGGYADPSYWNYTFFGDYGALPRDEGVALLVDATGRPGPATWELGTYPEGKADYPVGGVSWYEAAAYAEWAGKQLPTVYQWRHAAWLDIKSDVLFVSNFESDGPVPVDSLESLGIFGTYDLAGNVREWCWNASGGDRYLLGGAWPDPPYRYSTEATQRPIDREPTYGFRCVKSIETDSKQALAEVPQLDFDYTEIEPVGDELYAIYRSQYEYDPGDLEAKVEQTDVSNEHYTRHKITFNTPYGSGRMAAWLFTPRDVSPPYQCVVYFPGADALEPASSDRLFSPQFWDYIPRSGRALLYPVYFDTYERANPDYSGGPHQARERILNWGKEVQRSLDYLASRDDIDMDRIAYYGLSLGSTYGPIYTAVEERFSASVLLAGGLYGLGMTRPPEVSTFNFLPRSTLPTLMINGRWDLGLGLETSVRPFFDNLGTPEAYKRLHLADSDHIPPINDVIRETLAWLDTYLGSVAQQTQPTP